MKKLTRLEANLKIAEILKETPLEEKFALGTKLAELANKFPDQRAGQIVCNYICPDYRSGNPEQPTTEIMETVFPNDPDPFFEESIETLMRLTKDE